MNIFLEKALSQVPRILGFMGRDPDSKTLGCCDRAFWHYKTMDFANARFQEACLVLALAYLEKDPTNKFFEAKLMRRWSLSAAAFWFRQRHHDGSVDESYPFERHSCATAFSLHAVTETFLVFKEKLPSDLSNTGRFLMKHTNSDVANQVACSALSLYNLYLLMDEKIFKEGFEKKLDQLFELQNSQGAFREYGGFDLGYDSLTVGLLAQIYFKTRREDVKDSAIKCIGHLEPFLENDGYFSPEKMSRKTQFLYPLGFAVFHRDILEKIERGLQKNSILNPSWMDDRYCIPLTANYLMTAREAEKK